MLVAAHDAAASLPQALSSIARQGLCDWECIVVDDGSRDGTSAVVESFAAKDTRFRLLRQEHLGVVEARNHGLQRCRGEFLAILDADDRMRPSRLEQQVEALEADPRLVAIGCHVEYFPKEAVGEGRRAYEDWLNGQLTAADIRRDRYIEMPVGHPTLMVRAAALQSLRYRDQGWPEDWDLFQRLLGIGDVGIVPEVLHDWRLSPDSLARRSPTYAGQAFTACRAAFLAECLLAERQDYDLLGYGGTGKALRKALAKRERRCRRIFELHPGRIGQTLDGAEVLHHDALAAPPPRPLLVSVSGPQARSFLRQKLAALGYREETDFVCTA